MSLQAATKIENALSWDDEFLTWFSSLGIPIFEKRHNLGGFSYFHFEAQFKTADGRQCSTHGRSQNRKLAAVKAAAECIERKFLTEFYIELGDDETIPRSLRTSNGWAIHRTLDEAKNAALSEAKERHLLLKSFFTFGWNGFHLVQKIESEGTDLYFLLTRFRLENYASGIVVAKSKKHSGVSFGYCFGPTDSAASSQFWEPAIYEAIDKTIVLNGRPIDLSADPKSWLLAEIKYYLENPFDISVLKNENLPIHETSLEKPSIRHFDLSKKFGLNFPLFASFAFGGNYIPLFCNSRLTENDRQYVDRILRANGLSEIPERHPIL